jgi:hypothetical protein
MADIAHYRFATWFIKPDARVMASLSTWRKPLA